MNPKLFAQRLNQELDQIDFPTRMDERVEAFAKLMDIPRFKAESFLSGAAIPDTELLTRIADELEISVESLSNL
ncbi:MAG: hypothetical protein A3F18_04905 [Legionellales bacterium RIFCSPHIGHO2_12_FULL_37_14]|nr:MAG: hypothetical protein A3F18_04905 [Legionellales bacterium RIFCSPHIGHO2_12_FULL_37_14]